MRPPLLTIADTTRSGQLLSSILDVISASTSSYLLSNHWKRDKH